MFRSFKNLAFAQHSFQITNMKLYLGILIVLGVIALSEQSCKVLSQCEDAGIDWRKITHNVNESEPTAEATGPKLHYIANTMTWNTGRAFCDMMEKRLCYARELCVSSNGSKFFFDVIPGDNWAPVLDADNEWVEIGDSLKRTCFVHSQYYGKPDWGTSTDARPYKGFTYCCENNQDIVYKAIKYQYTGKTTTYRSSQQHCASQGRRLCRINEVCKGNFPEFGVVHGDMWVAVSDRVNEWVEIGNDGGKGDRICWIHGPHYGPPSWGIRTDGSGVNHVGYVYCCQD